MRGSISIPCSKERNTAIVCYQIAERYAVPCFEEIRSQCQYNKWKENDDK